MKTPPAQIQAHGQKTASAAVTPRDEKSAGTAGRAGASERYGASAAGSISVATNGPATGSPEIDEGEKAFNALFGEGASVNVTATSASAQEFDRDAVREIFAQIASNHARPIKNFMFELTRGRATKEWIDVCRPVLETLSHGAESTGLSEAAARMTDFGEALSLAAAGNSPFIEPDARDLILSAYQEMAEALPEAFRQGEEESRRETIVIHSLLKQVPDVGHVTFQRLYGAGLTTLEALFLANVDELAATTGIPPGLCQQIRDRFQDYRQHLGNKSAESGEAGSVAQLHRLVEILRRTHEDFKQAAAEDWTTSGATKKREARQERQRCALEIEVVLAEGGEFEQVETIQKMSFEQRIEALEQFLARVGVPAAKP